MSIRGRKAPQADSPWHGLKRLCECVVGSADVGAFFCRRKEAAWRLLRAAFDLARVSINSTPQCAATKDEIQRLEYKVRASDVGNESEKQRAEFLSQNS